MRPPYATYSLLAANILVFIALAIHLESVFMDTPRASLTIIHWGSNVNPLTLGGEPWRIFTSMFLHFGFWHLIINMFALHSLGTGLEPGVGAMRFVWIYLVCGVVANLFSLLLNVYVSSAGASGAIFGLYGYSLGAFLISNLSDAAARKRVMTSFIIFVIVNGLIAITLSVDVWGHIGGFVAGAILALVHFRFRIGLTNRSLAVTIGVLTACMFLLPRDQVRYYRLFQGVLAQERTTNGYYQHELSDAELLDSLGAAVRSWDSLEAAFAAMGHVRPALAHDSAVLRRYTMLNRQMTNYRVSLLARQSYTYMDSMELVNAAFDSVPALNYHPDYYPKSLSAESTPADTTKGADLVPRRVFYDKDWREIENPSAAVYYRLGQADSAGRWQGAVRDYYRSGNIQMKGHYTNDLKDGVFLYYSDHNTYTSAGRYQREEAVGKWESFHWNGALQSETYYNNTTFVRTVLDSLGTAQVQEGNGTVTTWHANGHIAETGQYRNGMRTGDWLGYHPDGTPYYREQYRENRLVQGAAVDVSGKRFVYDHLSLYAYPVKGMDNFDRYVQKNMRRHSSPTSGERIRVIFQVGKSGDMWDFVILEGKSPELQQEAIRLIREGPAWRAGLLHGHIPVPSQGYAVIQF